MTASLRRLAGANEKAAMATSTVLGAANLLIFAVGGRQFAVEVGGVEQILEYRPSHVTPRRPPYVEGILEHRGRYVPVLNLRQRLGLPEETAPHPAIVLLRGIGSDPLVGLVVDRVDRILSVPADGVLTPPPRVFGIRAEYVRGVANAGGRPVVWLDEVKLLTSAEPITLLA